MNLTSIGHCLPPIVPEFLQRAKNRLLVLHENLDNLRARIQTIRKEGSTRRTFGI
jgi:hypothetical protein